MSLFIGALAFRDPALTTPVHLGVYAGSVIAAIIGLTILSRLLPKTLSPDQLDDEDVTAPFIVAEPVFRDRDRL